MISVELANDILSLITAKSTKLATTSTGQCWLGFSAGDPGANGASFNEPNPSTYPSYARIQLNINDAQQWTDKWGSVANKSVSLLEEITTSECLEESGWPTFTHFGIFSNKTGGKPLAWDLLTDPDGEPDEDGQYPAKTLTVRKGEVAVFRTDSLKLTFK